MARIDKMWKDIMKGRSFDRASKESWKIYKDKYLKNNKDQPREEEFKTNFLVPGKIYTFIYTTDKGLTKKNPWMDKRPVILSFGQMKIGDKVYEGGINFNTVPPKMRIHILDMIYKSFESSIKSNQNAINKNSGDQKALPLNFQIASKVLGGTGFENAYFVYERGKMKDIKVFDYDDWAFVTSLNTEAIIGISSSKLWGGYIGKMNKKINRLKEIEDTFKNTK